ncbi:MAG: hypothetical protein DRI52_06675, partial [Chloroflexi bacterium]
GVGGGMVGDGVTVGVAVAGEKKGNRVPRHSSQEARRASPNNRITLQMRRGATILLMGLIIAVLG